MKKKTEVIKLTAKTDAPLRVCLVDSEGSSIALAYATDIEVQLVDRVGRTTPLEFTLDSKEINVLHTRIEGDQLKGKEYGIGISYKFMGNDYRTYSQVIEYTFATVVNDVENVTMTGDEYDVLMQVSLQQGEYSFVQGGEFSDDVDKSLIVRGSIWYYQGSSYLALVSQPQIAPTEEKNDSWQLFSRGVSDEIVRNCEDAAEKANGAALSANNAAERVEDAVELAKTASDAMNNKIQEVDEAEAERTESEMFRKQSEQSRDNSEQSRTEAEAERKNAEQNRASAETDRDNAESNRETNEEARATNESDRISNESDRDSAESVRRSNELKRQEQEAARDAGEDSRESRFTYLVEQNQKATDAANSAAQLATEKLADIKLDEHKIDENKKAIDDLKEDIGEPMPLDEVDRICAEAWGVSEEEFK